MRSAGVIGTLTILSRILGYVRDQRIAYLLGTTVAADSYVLAYRIPNLLRRLVAEGSMTAAFIPVFTRYLAQSKKEGSEADWVDFANRMFWTLSLVLSGIVLLGLVLSPQLVRLMTLGGSHIDIPHAVLLNRIMWPFLLFIGLSALSMAILNSFRVFAVPALTPTLLNLAIITMSFLAYRFSQPSIALAIGVVIGGVLQFVIQVPLLRKHGMTLQPHISFSDKGIRQVAKLMVPGLFGIGVAQINFVVDTVFATLDIMGPGALMALQTADRVMELVLGGYALAIATALLPAISRQVAEKNMEEFRHTLSFSLRLVSFITIPAMVGLMVLREPIIQVLFEHGRFNQESTRITAWALLFFSMGLPWFAATKIIVPAFYSTYDTRTPVKVAAFVMLANIVLNIVFAMPLRNGGPAAATSVAGALNFSILLVIFRRKHGELDNRALLASLARVCTAAVLMGVACWAMLRVSIFADYSTHPFSLQVLVLGGMLAAAVSLFFAVTWLLRSVELHELYDLLRRRGKTMP